MVEVVMLSLADNTAVEETMHGPQGVLGGLRAGATVIDLSTVSPRTSRAMALEVQAQGGSMLGAPVSGSTPQAEQGTLIIMVGGDEDAYRRGHPILQVLGKQCFYLGSNGMGLVMKLVANAMLGLGLQALAEAIALGEGGGLDTERLLDVLGQSAVISPSQKSRLENARHDPHMAAEVTRSKASVGASTRASSTVSTRSSITPWTRTAFIAFSSLIPDLFL